MVEEQNNEFRQQHERGELSAKALAKALLAMPTALKKPTYKWCRAFSKNFGWSLLSSSTEQASLPMNHPDMILYRQRYEAMLASGVHPHMVINFDQVWRCAFQWDGKMQWKPRANIGRRGRKVRNPKVLDKKRHAVRGARKSVTVLWSSQVFFLVYLVVCIVEESYVSSSQPCFTPSKSKPIDFGSMKVQTAMLASTLTVLPRKGTHFIVE